MPIATLTVPAPLDRRAARWLADALSMIAVEYLKGEHMDARVIEIAGPADGEA